MQRALLAALLTGLAAPAIGTFIVQRRLALLGDGIGHVAVTGVALGLLTGASPTWTAVVVAILGAVLIEVIREQGHTNGDVALALLFYGGLAGGVLITGLAGDGAAGLQVYLFGSVTSISPSEVWYTAGLALVVLTLTLGLLPQLFAVASDPEFARVAGLRVRTYNLLVAVLAAVSVTVAMRTVGLLLVSALMVVPVATSQQLARSFRSTLLGAMVVGGVAAVGGLVVAAWLSARATVAPGPSIVLLALVITVGPHADAAPPVSVATDLWSYDHVPGELLVGFRSQPAHGAESGISGAFNRYLSSFGVRSASPAIGDGRTYRLSFDLADDLRARRDQLLRDPKVAYVEPNYIVTMAAGPTGPLVPNDEKSRKQLTVVHKLLRSPEVELVVNACDAGREGELIFAYIYETAKVDKPISSMVIKKVFLRPQRSPSRPNTNAPNGRTAKPAAKASSARM